MPARTPLALKRVGHFGRPVTQHSPQTRNGGGVSGRVCLSARGVPTVSAGARLTPRVPVSSQALTQSQRSRWTIASSQRTRLRRPRRSWC
eukprot:12680914-Alexandrium_andersonii.AAC.1